MSITSPPINTAGLARRLNSLDDAERQQAQEELRALLAADVRRSHILRGMLGVLGLIFWCVWMIHASGTPFITHFRMTVLVVFLLASYVLSLFQKQIGRRIANLDMPQAVGPLISVQAGCGRFRHGDITMALIRLLPRLQASDAPMLTVDQRADLYRILYTTNFWPYRGRLYGVELKLAILRALEQVGDEKALLHVEKLARSARNIRVRATAQECVPFLHHGAQRTRFEQTLLRASTPTPAPDTLLRASISSPQTEPHQLLRATSSDTDRHLP